jgi:hypothetical protein
MVFEHLQEFTDGGQKLWNRIPLGSLCCESRHESGVGIHHGVRGKGVGSRSVADGGSLFPGVAFVLKLSQNNSELTIDLRHSFERVCDRDMKLREDILPRMPTVSILSP